MPQFTQKKFIKNSPFQHCTNLATSTLFSSVIINKQTKSNIIFDNNNNKRMKAYISILKTIKLTSNSSLYLSIRAN